MPLALWYANNPDDISEFEKQMRRKVHYVIQPPHLWTSIVNLARTQNGELLNTLQAGFKYIETESFDSTFRGLFSEINLGSDKLGKTYADRNAKLCTIIQKIAEGLAKRCQSMRMSYSEAGLLEQCTLSLTDTFSALPPGAWL